MRKDFNNLCHACVEELYEFYITCLCFLNILAYKALKTTMD